MENSGRNNWNPIFGSLFKKLPASNESYNAGCGEKISQSIHAHLYLANVSIGKLFPLAPLDTRNFTIKFAVGSPPQKDSERLIVSECKSGSLSECLQMEPMMACAKYYCHSWTRCNYEVPWVSKRQYWTVKYEVLILRRSLSRSSQRRIVTHNGFTADVIEFSMNNKTAPLI